MASVDPLNPDVDLFFINVEPFAPDVDLFCISVEPFDPDVDRRALQPYKSGAALRRERPRARTVTAAVHTVRRGQPHPIPVPPEPGGWVPRPTMSGAQQERGAA